MMMLPMVRFIYLVLMMRKVSMSEVLMGLLAPLVVRVSASLLIDKKTISRHKGCRPLVIEPLQPGSSSILFLGHVFGVDDDKDVFEFGVDGSIGTLGPTT